MLFLIKKNKNKIAKIYILYMGIIFCCSERRKEIQLTEQETYISKQQKFA